MDKRLADEDVTATKSAFDEAAAAGIAQKAVRRCILNRHSPPLAGRELELLAALQAAELAHRQTLASITQGEGDTQVGADANRKRGRRPGVGQSGNHLPLSPLHAFAAVLKAFWEPTTGGRFGFEVERYDGAPGGGVPKSAATRLMCEAVGYLDQDYTMANIGTVMRKLQRASPK